MHESLVHLWESSRRKYGDRELFGTKTGTTWSWLTYEALGGTRTKKRAYQREIAAAPPNLVPQQFRYELSVRYTRLRPLKPQHAVGLRSVPNEESGTNEADGSTAVPSWRSGLGRRPFVS